MGFQNAARGLSALGFADPVSVSAALAVGGQVGQLLGVSPARFRSPEENYRIRVQMVDAALARALQQDQAAVLQLWLWTGIPGDGVNHLPTRAARDYAVGALRRYYATSGADPLDAEWMQALQSPSPQPRLNRVPPVPSVFEGSEGFSIPGFNVGGMGGALPLVAIGVVAWLATRKRARR